MPTVEEQRKAERRAYLLSLRKGSFIQCDLAMRAVTIRAHGRTMDVTPPLSEAAIEAEKKAKADADYKWWLKSIGPW
jgi:hypothetical protein